MRQCDTCNKIIEGPDVVRADFLAFCNEECAKRWLDIEIANESEQAQDITPVGEKMNDE